MTAEAIAACVADLAAGGDRVQVLNAHEPTRPVPSELAHEAVTVARECETIDATPLYRSILDTIERGPGINLYEDHPCVAPPWPTALVSYVNDAGNVVLMAQRAEQFDVSDPDHMEARDFAAGVESIRDHTNPGPWEPAEPVDWSHVRWIIRTTIWRGGRAGGRPVALQGPFLTWYYAIYADGTPADLHWVNLVGDGWQFQDGTSGGDHERWQIANLVNLGVLNFMNATNVDIVEPARPRPERRRIARTGVTVKVLNVFPSGRSTRSARRPGPAAGVPLHTVRGHWSHYGACCPHHEPRGLLFGKYTGRVWVPMSARGSAEHGEIAKTYRPVPQD